MADFEYRMPTRVLLIALLLAFGIFMPLFIVPPLEDILSRQMSISHIQASLFYTLPIAMLALVAIPAGFLADRIGLKKSIGIGALVLILGSALRATTTDFLPAVLLSALYGVGVGLCFPNIPKLARHCSSRQRSHFTVSLFILGILTSGALSLAIARPVLYGLTGSPQGAFAAGTAPMVIALALWWPLISDPPCPRGENSVRVDFNTLKKVLARTDLWLVCLLFFLHNFALFTFAGWLPQFLIDLGAGTGLAGLITSVTLWIGLPSILLASRLSTRLGRRKPFIWGPSLLLVGTMYWATFITVPLSWALAALTGMGTTVRFSIILSVPVEMVSPFQAGMASGMVMSLGYTGAVAGPLIGATLLDVTGGFFWIFVTLMIVSVMTVAVALVIPETGGKRE